MIAPDLLNHRHEPGRPVRVAIVEDHPAYREVVGDIIRGAAGLELTGIFGSLRDVVEAVADADVVLMDIGLPDFSGIQGVALVKKRNPSIKVIMVTNFNDDENVFQAIAAGADGYLLKKSSTTRILDAIQDVVTGGATMAPFIARRVLDALVHGISKPVEGEELSARETEILGLLVEGMNYKTIAAKLFISPDTVRNHIRNIYERLHVHSRSEAVAKAIRQKLI
jgi:DNA-binding NarL/FixJ family response regulator